MVRSALIVLLCLTRAAGQLTNANLNFARTALNLRHHHHQSTAPSTLEGTSDLKAWSPAALSKDVDEKFEAKAESYAQAHPEERFEAPRPRLRGRIVDGSVGR